MVHFLSLALVAAICDLARAHTVITYPGSGTGRGNNLITNGTDPADDPGSIGIDYVNGSFAFPYGMQYQFPCGGLPASQNRTKWPYQGGALSIQPGWQGGHQSAFIYINLGINSNFSFPMVPPLAISGRTEAQYTSQFCLPQVPMPVGANLQVGDLVTLQVVELMQTGAALYSCVDLELVDPLAGGVEEVSSYNCYNSSDIGISIVFTSAALTTSAAQPRAHIPSALVYSAPLAIAAVALAWL